MAASEKRTEASPRENNLHSVSSLPKDPPRDATNSANRERVVATAPAVAAAPVAKCDSKLHGNDHGGEREVDGGVEDRVESEATMAATLDKKAVAKIRLEKAMNEFRAKQVAAAAKREFVCPDRWCSEKAE